MCGQTNKQTNKQTNRQTNKQKNKQTNKLNFGGVVKISHSAPAKLGLAANNIEQYLITRFGQLFLTNKKLLSDDDT